MEVDAEMAWELMKGDVMSDVTVTGRKWLLVGSSALDPL